MKTLFDHFDLVVSLLHDLSFSKFGCFLVLDPLLCLLDVRPDLLKLFILLASHLLESPA